MHDIASCHAFTISDLAKINRCRLYLRVTTLSDITSGDGKTICKQYWDGYRDDERILLHDWPEQGDPGDKDWTLWRRALKTAFPQQQRKLENPLGRWVDKYRNKWKWFYHPLSKQLYTKRLGTDRWKIYTRLQRNATVRKGTRFKYYTDSMSLPPTAQRATILHLHNHITFQGSTSEGVTYIPNDTAHNEIAQSWMVQNVRNEGNIHHIATHLQHGGKLEAVSDGSYHPSYKRGTAAWVVSITNTTTYIIASNSTPGRDYQQCSHRSELSGLIGTIRHINMICKTYQITTGLVELGCDGEEAYKMATRYTYQPSTKISHFDLVTQLHYLIQTSPIKWQFRHVGGHQDKYTSYNDLDCWARMNIHADKLAKQHLWDDIHHHAPRFDTPYIINTLPTASLLLDNEYHAIVSRCFRTLTSEVGKQRCKRYWKSKNRPIDDPLIDIHVLEHATANLPTWDSRWISKWSSGHCGVGVKLAQWKEQSHSKCPRCSTDYETVEHVICCKHVDATSIWTTGLEDI